MAQPDRREARAGRCTPLIELNAVYAFPTFAQVRAEYNRPDFRLVFLVEASYEFEHNPHTDGGSPQNLRRQQYWAILSGATGHVYGSAYTWRGEHGGPAYANLQGNRGRCGEAARQTLWGFRRRRSIAEVC